MNADELINYIITKLDYIKPEDVPNIDLYMDQVTTFMDKQLEHSKRFGEDKILTKTMINNYAKNSLLPPSDKKKYSREHVLLLIFIYYFKNILSINDIKKLLTPITDTFFHSDNPMKLNEIYEEIFELEKEQLESIKADVLKKYERSLETFQNTEGKDKDFLQLFSLICILSFDVYTKKQMIESMIDQLPVSETKKKEKKDE